MIPITHTLGGWSVGVALLAACGGGVGTETTAGGADAAVVDPGEDGGGGALSGPGVIPDLPFPGFTEAQFVVDEDLGVRLVAEHLLLGFALEATDDEIAAALGAEAAEIAGGLPEGGVVLLRFPGATAAQLGAAATRLGALPGVSGAARIGPIHAAVAPVSSDRASAPFWTWSGQSWPLPAESRNVNGTWALRTIAAPGAWNLRLRLRAQPEPPPPPVVGFIDADLFSHPDVVFDKAARNRPPGPFTGSHGLSVMGTAGALWGNGRFTDGVTPSIDMIAVDNSVAHGEAVDVGPLTDVALFAKPIELLRRARRPRVINISMNRTYSAECHGDFRCDPRGPSADEVRAPDVQCDAAAERNRTATLALMFAAFSARLQRAAPVFFIQAAGNDGGDPYSHDEPASLRCPADVTPAGTETYCQLLALGCSPRRGLGGHLPAALASPLAAATGLPGFSDVLVVGAAAPADKSSGAWSLSWFSNDGGQLVAPGERIVVPSVVFEDGMPVRTLEAVEGTSVAAPLATGVAAYLLSIEPTLTNAELLAALTSFTAGGRVAGATTSARLDMMAAVLAIDDLRPMRFPKLGELLADVDDGTPDGFTREVIENGERRPYRGRREVGRDAGVLDMRDFRAIRDVYLMQSQIANLPCDAATPACDLNGDGVAAAPSLEPFPRTLLVGAQSPYVSLASVDFLASRAGFSDPVQGWRALDLRSLIRSADVVLQPDLFMAAAGADELLITLEGSVFPEDPQVVNAVPLIETSVFGETVLTTPLRKSPRILVRPVRRGVPDENFVAADLDELKPGEDRRLVLNPCAWTHGEPLLAPVTGQCLAPDEQLPDPNQVHFWIRFSGADVPARTYVMEFGPDQNTMFTAYEPWNDRTFIHGGGWWRNHRDISLTVTMEWMGNGAGAFRVYRFHEGGPDPLPTGIAFSADADFDAPEPRLNVDVYSVDVAIQVTQAGLPGRDDMIGTFAGEGELSDGDLVGVPVNIEGGFRARTHDDVPAPQ